MTHRLIVNGELLLYGVVGGGGFFMPDGFTASEVARALAEMSGDITVRVNSPGGIARDGVAIYHLLKDHKGKVTVKVDAIAASAASVFCMAAAEIMCPKSATIMIHAASGITIGTREDHQNTAAVLEKLDGQMASLYARRSGQSIRAVERMMAEETWLDGDEAVEKGFADSAPEADVDEPEASAFDYTIYQHAPERLRTRAPERAAPDVGARMAVMSAAPMQEVAMANPQAPADKTSPVAFTTVAELAAAYPELTAAIRKEASEQAAATAATAERDRIFGIDAIAVAGHTDLIAKCKADPSCTPEKAAMQILAAEKAQRGAQRDAIAAVETVAAVVKPAPTAGGAGNEPKPAANTPDGWKAEYDASKDLQAEFGSVETYVAFKQGESSGRVRVLRQRA